MKKPAIVIDLMFCLLMIFLTTGITQAKGWDKQSELLASCQKVQRCLTLPAGTSAEQRALVALNVAIAQLGVTNTGEIQSVYKQLLNILPWVEKSDTSYQWDGSKWTNVSNTTYHYGGWDRESSEMTQSWTGTVWVNADQTLFGYDGSNRLSTITDQQYQDPNWVNTDKTTFSYDVNGYTSQILYQQWRDSVGGVWANGIRSTNYYTGARMDSTISEDYPAGAWELAGKLVYSYTSGHLMQMLSQGWIGTGWFDASRSTYYPDANGRDTLEVTELFLGTWQNSWKTQYSYDGSGNEILKVYWNYSGGWSKSYADTSKYSGDLLTETVTYDYINTFLSHRLYTYDGNGNNTQELQQTYSGSSWDNETKRVHVYEQGLAVEVDNGRIPSVFELSQNYPNPFNPITVIRYSLRRPSQVNITVFNVLGQEVKTLESGVQSAGTYETTWDGTNQTGREVASGIYFYRIKAGEFNETRKMLLLK